MLTTTALYPPAFTMGILVDEASAATVVSSISSCTKLRGDGVKQLTDGAKWCRSSTSQDQHTGGVALGQQQHIMATMEHRNSYPIGYSRVVD